METCVNNRLTIGAPGRAAMEKVIEAEKAYLAEDWKRKLNTVKRYCKKCTKNTRKDDIFFYKIDHCFFEKNSIIYSL